MKDYQKLTIKDGVQCRIGMEPWQNAEHAEDLEKRLWKLMEQLVKCHQSWGLGDISALFGTDHELPMSSSYGDLWPHGTGSSMFIQHTPQQK